MAEAPSPLPARLVLYDGLCGFCDRAVQRLLEVDQRQQLHFAPLQGITAAAIRARHPEWPPNLDSIVYVETENGRERVTWWSEAALRIADTLDLHSPWLTVARRLPRRFVDLGYRVFAALRYSVFGGLHACRIPSPELRARFLD